MSASVLARLGASVLALLAGVVAVVVAVELLRSTPGPVSGATSSLAAAPQTTTRPVVAGGRIPVPRYPGFPSPPSGAVVLAQEAGTRDLALAVSTGGSPLVRVSVVSGQGVGVGGLAVKVSRPGSAPVALAACGSGCYQANVPGAPAARSLVVTLGRERFAFALPGGHPADATAILTHAGAVWRRLKTLVWRETLASNPTDTLTTIYTVVAPSSLGYRIVGHSQALMIGMRRWDRPGAGARWTRSVQNPPVHEPVPFWVGITDAHVLGRSTFRGRPVWDVSFFDPQTPGWFSVKIDRANGRTLDLRMTATAHFMHHVYGPFNAPITLKPPASG